MVNADEQWPEGSNSSSVGLSSVLASALPQESARCVGAFDGHVARSISSTTPRRSSDLGELAPSRHRGLVVGVQSVMITGGQLVSYAIGAGMTFHKGWRVLFALSIPPAIFQAFALHWLPESPRYDLIKGRREKAKATLRVVYRHGTEDFLERKVDLIAKTVAIGQRFNEAYPGIFQRFRAIVRTGPYRRPVLVSATLFLTCQLGGVNSLMCEPYRITV
jgi:MFS transporter, SP family, solute carrier family 2 (myo-inositol transporter), member 13